MSKNELVVIGIGASAGGLEALQIMLTNLEDIENCAYVIAQHLSPTHKSMMVELLSRTTNIPVIEVKNAMLIKAKTIYMTPENTDIYVKGNRLYLKSIEQSFGPKPSINYFFSSLANSFTHRSIGVILSGTGSDGSFGIRSIKAEGGITIAQSPNTAKYDGMPLSAINTGKVDLVIPIDKLSNEISRIVRSIDIDFKISQDERTLQQIYRILFEEQGIDFSLYKRNTLIRRIERRLAALKIETLSEYLKVLKESKEEVVNLYHDILIGVTSFFRDEESFETLKKYIEIIINKKEQGEEIRFWSIGCSTGEEAYSIAIILAELLEDKISKYKIKIFATDVDDESLKIARTGIYSETSLENVPKGLIQKYFSVQKNNFEIKKSIRELVIFSKHNIISDSPFLRLDLITCRNLLIYFNQNLQNRFFPIIHYSLKDSGYLFLGKSESVGQHLDLFSLVDKNAKIFKAQFTGIKEPPKLYNYSTSYKNYEEPKLKKYKNEEEVLEEKINDAISELVLDKCVVINSSNDIVYVKGNIPFLKLGQGRMSNNIFKLLSDELSLDLRSCLNEVKKSKTIKLTPFRSITIFESIIRYVRVIIVPFKDDKSDDWMNVLFFQSEESQNIKGHVISSSDENEVIEKLTLELDSTKSHLQNVIEELETSYEEMQSLNEELQSSNEELQSSNEELETTNEELQSTNEELQTAYSELRVLYEDKEKRTKQLEDLTEKLSMKSEEYRKQKELTEIIIDTATTSIMMVDVNSEITFVNKQVLNLFNMKKTDLLGKKFDSIEIDMQTFDGKKIEKDDSPFYIIRKNFEPISDLKLVVQIDFNKLYLSISGAALFDVEGKFKGAVFCIDNLTNSEIMRNDLEQYENSLILNSPVNKGIGDDRFDILEIALLDTTTTIRNELNNISLISHLIDSKDENVINNLEKINEKVSSLSTKLDKRLNTYIDTIKYKMSYLNLEIESILNLFSSVFESYSINIEFNEEIEINHKISVKQVRKLLYVLIEFIISIKVQFLENKQLDIVLNIIKEDKNAILIFDFKHKKLLDKQIDIEDIFNNNFYNFFETSKVNVELFFNEKMQCKCEL